MGGQETFLKEASPMAEQELSLLHRMEREVLAEGQEWMQKRLQERLQKLADAEGEVSPPQRAASGASAPKRRRAAKRGRKG